MISELERIQKWLAMTHCLIVTIPELEAAAGWIEWNGVVPPNQEVVEVKLRCGETRRDYVSRFVWACFGTPYDIVAYREF